MPTFLIFSGDLLLVLKVKLEKTLRCELQPPPAPEPELASSSFSGLEAWGWEGTQGTGSVDGI